MADKSKGQRGQRECGKKARGANLKALPSRSQIRKSRRIGGSSERKPLPGLPPGKLRQDIPDRNSPHPMTRRSSTRDSMHNRDSTISDNTTTQLPHASTSALPTFSTVEPVIRESSPMPPGYSFVPKGDPYLTRHCRQQTQQAHQVVYVVVNNAKKQVGIRVPESIYTEVLQSESATRQSRQQKVKKSDEDLEKRFRDAIHERFPRIPAEEIPLIARYATAKGEGRVGRTGRIEIAEKAYRAVQAHIRHTKTNYENLLKRGVGREKARSSESRKIIDLLRKWGPAPTKTRTPTKSTKNKRAQTASLTKRVSERTAPKTAKQGARARHVKAPAAPPDIPQQEGATTGSTRSRAKRTNPPSEPPVNADRRRAKLEKRRRYRKLADSFTNKARKEL
ncbi:hypothetical protein ANO14919_144540 [Xylariales sp. No.14919]|nr:hypothetical protein ANO14919_144540 [Xylariales sp. No.14919]